MVDKLQKNKLTVLGNNPALIQQRVAIVAALVGLQNLNYRTLLRSENLTRIDDLLVMIRAIYDPHEQKPEATPLPSFENARDRFIRLMAESGWTLIGRDLRRNYRMTFKNRHAIIRVLTYVANPNNKSGQISFSVSYLGTGKFDWIAFCCAPWERIHLFRREEIEKRTPKKDGALPKTTRLTFSKGVEDNLFEDRVGELISDFIVPKQEVNKTSDLNEDFGG